MHLHVHLHVYVRVVATQLLWLETGAVVGSVLNEMSARIPNDDSVGYVCSIMYVIAHK